MSIIKVQKKGQVTLPTSVTKRVGIADGDLLEVKLHRGTVVLTPKRVIDRSAFPAADDEYTPAQRRVIDARLAEGLADIQAGRIHGPFNTHAEMMSVLKKESQKPNHKKK